MVPHSCCQGAQTLATEVAGFLPPRQHPPIGWLARIALQRPTDPGIAERILCPTDRQAISTLGGLTDESLVPRVFYQTPGGLAQQLSLFEESAEYDLD